MVAAVLLGHALLLGGALRLTVWRDRQAPRREAPPLQVLLLRLPTATAPAAPPATLRPAMRREPQAITILPASAAPDTPRAITQPAPTEPATVAVDEPASAPPRPLDLRLPRRPPGSPSASNPALDDPRANTARPATVESRIAAALGGVDGIVEEHLDDGRMRLRRGTSCVIVHPNRAERIDPFNASSFPKLRGVESC